MHYSKLLLELVNVKKLMVPTINTMHYITSRAKLRKSIGGTWTLHQLIFISWFVCLYVCILFFRQPVGAQKNWVGFFFIYIKKLPFVLLAMEGQLGWIYLEVQPDIYGPITSHFININQYTLWIAIDFDTSDDNFAINP